MRRYKIFRILFVNGDTYSLRAGGFKNDGLTTVFTSVDYGGANLPQTFPTRLIRRVFVGRI